jgi:aspartate dehydrogenase
MLRVALIGCGAIGSSVIELLKGDASLAVVAVVVPHEGVAAAQAVLQTLAPGVQVGTAVPASGVDLVVETAGHAAIEEHVLPALRRGTPCVVASVGALSAQGLAEKLEIAAITGGTQVQLIAGAIGAIDALAAARIGGLDNVRYTGRKPPRAWKGTPAEQGRDLDALTAECVIFEGSAREAATVSLAGLGLDRTQVRLIADPAVDENVHTVEAEGAFGSFELSMRNKPLAANPKTSALTVYSAVRALRNRAAALAI